MTDETQKTDQLAIADRSHLTDDMRRDALDDLLALHLSLKAHGLTVADVVLRCAHIDMVCTANVTDGERYAKSLQAAEAEAATKTA